MSGEIRRLPHALNVSQRDDFPFAPFQRSGDAVADSLADSLADYDAVLRENPSDISALLGRAASHYGAGEFEQAAAAYAETVQRQPEQAQPYNDYAWLLATATKDAVRNGARALELATQACKRTEYKNPGYLDTLAAAHAEKGDFSDALKWQEEAVKLAGDESEELRAELQSRIELYKAKKPYREEPK